ncbi:hypothetical protein CJ030_MR7G001539 [Morella rubra]|uniref:Uncharacterized protein n=1 Tax=Morella rubra TaxID=262757 RepID=A0A6A1V1S5_9ROSI|nr:hypothetical protein CJ030_MR7G001547 [Morella rubra]KAB1206647.1 hypothetical protein CJ030_MR7G001539 [Morella rubra]
MVVPSLERPSVLEAAVISGLDTSASIPTDEPGTSAVNVVSGSVMPLTLSARGKEQVACPSILDDPEESDSEPPASPAWYSRLYAQSLLIKELIKDSLSLPRHVKVDRIVRDLSHSVTMLVALDAAELSHDEKLESTRLSLEESLTSLSLRVAELSVMLAFLGDPMILARRYIGAAMAVLEVAHENEGSHFMVSKNGSAKKIYQHLVENLGTCGRLMILVECDWKPGQTGNLSSPKSFVVDGTGNRGSPRLPYS